MSKYEEACQKACAGCAARGGFRHTAHFHSTTCTAPALEAWAEQLAERVERLEAIIKEHGGLDLLSLEDAVRHLAAANKQNMAEAERLESQNRELLEALQIYADEKNWNCPRCGNRDSLNCFMGRWTGPVDKGDGYSGGGHGYDIARTAIARATGRAEQEKTNAT